MFLSVISRASTALLNELWYVGCCSRESSLVCLKICLEHKSNVILCKPPIRSTANHFLKLRLWGLVLKPHLVECWKVHLVFSPHPFYSDPCRAHEKAMKFSMWVEGSFMLQENQTKPKQNFMFQLSYGKPVLPPPLSTHQVWDDTWKSDIWMWIKSEEKSSKELIYLQETLRRDSWEAKRKLYVSVWSV